MIIFTFILLVLLADWWIEIRAPSGEVLKVATDATFQGGRIKSLNEVICFISFYFKLIITITKQLFPSEGCGVRVSNINKKDEGEWR